jgi:hypothetical protein
VASNLLGRTYNVDVQHNPHGIECCIATVREHPYLMVHGMDYDEVKQNIRDLIRCHLDCEEGEGAGDQTFRCNYRHI